MTYIDDYEYLHKIRYRWQKEQQVIRKKYQIPFNIIYTSKTCFNKHISINEKLYVADNNSKSKIYQSDKYNIKRKVNHHTSTIVNCSKCHLNRTKCSCLDDLSKRFSIHSSPKQDITTSSSLIDLSSIEQVKSQNPRSKQYALIDWNNRQSLLNFIRWTELFKNPSSMTIEQLHDLISNHDYIHIFHSITDLVLFISKEKGQLVLANVYIDPHYYSSIQGAIPYFQSQLIADNVNLDRALRSFKKISYLLGIKSDPYLNKILEEKISMKQQKSILNQQSLVNSSKIPYNVLNKTSVHT